MKRLLLLLLLCCINGLVRNVRAQEYFYYDVDTVRHPVILFRLNNEQAEKVLFDNGVEDTVLLKSLQVADYNFTSEHIDQDTYEDGYYLTATLSSPYKVSYELLPKIPFHIVYNNKYGGLGIQLLDKKSLAYIENAEVRIGSYKLHYEPAIKSYRTSFDFNSGVLEIKIRDRKYWMALNKRKLITAVTNQPSIIRPGFPYNMYDLAATPAYIQSFPLRMVQYRNIWWGFNIHQLGYSLLGSNYHFLRSLPQPGDRTRKQYNTSYFFSKPEYRKGDTVKVKFFLETNAQRFCKRKIGVYIKFDKKAFTTEVSPADGDNGYDLEFVLDDSLGIRSGTSYCIFLEDARRKVVSKIYFYVNQYRLEHNDFNVYFPKGDWYKGNIAPVRISTYNKAALPVFGARVSLAVLAGYFSDRHISEPRSTLFIPDTMYTLDTVLDNIADYKLYIPDSIFKNQNINFEIYCRVSHGDYVKQAFAKGHYWSRKRELHAALGKDGLKIFNTLEGDTSIHPLYLRGYDAFGHLLICEKLHKHQNDKSFIWPVNQGMNKIILDDSVTGQQKIILIKDLEKQPLAVTSYIDKGFIHVAIHNPYRIVYQLFTYSANREIDKLISDAELQHLKYPYDIRKEHYLFINTLWGGESKFYSFGLNAPIQGLNLNVQHKEKIFPGARDEWLVTVTDEKGRSVNGVSLFSYAHTNKFTRESADDHYFDYIRTKKQKKGGKNYDGVSQLYFSGQERLHYNIWKTKFGIAAQDYYTMLYADTVVQEFVYPSQDSFSYIIPVVIKNNRIQPVSFVRYNNRMHYVGGADLKAPYAIKVSDHTDSHNIRLVSLDTLYDFTVKGPQSGGKVVKIVVIKPWNVSGKTVPFSMIPYTAEKAAKEIEPYTLVVQRNSEGYGQSAVVFPGYAPFILSGIGAQRKDNYFIIAPFGSDRWSYEVNRKYDGNKMSAFRQYRIEENRLLPGYAYYFESPNRTVLTSLDKNVYVQLLKRAGVPRLNLYNAGFRKVSRDTSGSKDESQDAGYWKRGVLSEMKFNNDTVSADIAVWLDCWDILSDPLYKLNFDGLNILFIKKNEPFGYEFLSADTISHRKMKAGIYDIVFFDSKRMYKKDNIDLQAGGLYRLVLDKPDRCDTAIIAAAMKNCPGSLTAQERAALFMQSLFQVYYKDKIVTFKGTISKGNLSSDVPVWVRYQSFYTLADSEGNYLLHIPKIALASDTVMEMSYVGGFWRFNEKVKEKVVSQAKVSSLGHRVIDLGVVTLSISEMLEGNETISYWSGSPRKVSYVSQGTVAQQSMEFRKMTMPIPVHNTVSLSSAAGSPLVIVDNKLYNGSILAFSEKVRNTFKVVTDPAYVALYGDAARNGVIFISTKDYDPADLPADIASQTVPGDQPEGTASLRSYFNDAAFWVPHVRTDKYGKAAFTVRYPDDITAWEAAIIATKGRKLRGKYQATVNAFKPLFTTSHLPRFIVEGDSLWFSNTIQNLTPDSLTLLARLSLNDSVVSGKSIALFRSYDDVLLLKAQTGIEHMKVQYEVVKEDGYLDGEVHDLPVLPRGVVVNKGEAVVLNGDTAIFLKQLSPGKEVLVAAYTQQYDIIKEEAMHLFRYRHLCNEQLSAKIIGLVNYIRIRKALDEPVDGKIYKALNRYVELLLQRKKADGTWSWWGEGAADYWVSARAYQALLLAGTVKEMTQPAGFTKATQVYMESRLDGTMDHRSKISLLEILKGLGTPQAYLDTVITRMLDDSRLRPALHTVQRYQLIAMLSTEVMKQYSREFLNYHSDVYGNAYFTADSGSLWNNDMVLNAYALQCLVSQPELNPAVRPGRVASWLIANRSFNGWRNTYESSLAIQAIARTLDLAAIQKEEVRLCVGNDTITRFPYTGSLNSDAAVKVAKSGYRPVFFSYYYRQRDTLGVHKSDVFAVKTFINRKDTTTCRVDLFEDFELLVEVEVKKDAEFMVLEIPLPAGCIAKADPVRHRYESHREYLDEQVNIALPALKKGTYTFSIPVKAQYKGVFTMNPAKIEMMYMPLNYGTSGVKTIEVR